MSVAAVILAAGESRRLGHPKQLVEFQQETLLNRAIRVGEKSGCEPVLVVLGAHFERIVSSVTSEHAILIRNDDWQQGIAASIHAGLGAVESAAPDVAGVLLMTCDQPTLTTAHLAGMLEIFRTYNSGCIVPSSYAGVFGVPAIFPRGVFPNLFALSGDQGARNVIAYPPCEVVACEFPGGDLDIDLPEDLEELG